MSFINEHRERFGVEPICDTLQVAPSTYYAALSRPPSERQVRDGELKVEIARVHQDNFDVYGTEKVWKQQFSQETQRYCETGIAQTDPPGPRQLSEPPCRDPRRPPRTACR